MNMNKTDFIFDLQIKIDVIFNEYYFKEDFLVYALPIELKDELMKEDNTFKDYLNKNKILLVIILIIIVIMLIFIILYFKMKKKIEILKAKFYLFPLPQEVVKIYSVNIRKIKKLFRIMVMHLYKK